MATDESEKWLLLLPESVRTLPVDLAAALGLTALACVFALVPGLNETPLRLLFSLPLVLFVPGYVFVAALFPEAGESPIADDADEERDTAATTNDEMTDIDGAISHGFSTGSGIDGIERVALSFGLSIAIVPLVGLLLNFTPWGIRLGPILVSLTGFVVVTTAIAETRRKQLPESERFEVPYRRWIDDGRAELFDPTSRFDAVLNLILVVSVLLALGSVAYAVAVPPEGESFSEFYVLSEDDDGELTAAGYPTNFSLGESKPIVVGVGNHEHEPTQYSVVVQLQRVEITDNETQIRERTELDRFKSPEIGHNDTWNTEIGIRPMIEGESLRVQFLLYRGDVPTDPTGENAYRTLHLWVAVEG